MQYVYIFPAKQAKNIDDSSYIYFLSIEIFSWTYFASAISRVFAKTLILHFLSQPSNAREKWMELTHFENVLTAFLHVTRVVLQNYDIN